jgi:hypothetical protein
VRTSSRLVGQGKTRGILRLADVDQEAEWHALAVLGGMLRGVLPERELQTLVAKIGGEAAFLDALRLVDLYLAAAGGAALLTETRAMRQLVGGLGVKQDGPTA